MPYYHYKLEEVSNNLWRDKERHKIEDENLKRINELENEKNLS